MNRPKREPADEHTQHTHTHTHTINTHKTNQRRRHAQPQQEQEQEQKETQSILINHDRLKINSAKDRHLGFSSRLTPCMHTKTYDWFGLRNDV